MVSVILSPSHVATPTPIPFFSLTTTTPFILYAHVMAGASITPEAVEALIFEANEYALASHLFWGIWGLMQSQQSDIDFDFVAYSSQRLEQYHKQR